MGERSPCRDDDAEGAGNNFGIAGGLDSRRGQFRTAGLRSVIRRVKMSRRPVELLGFALPEISGGQGELFLQRNDVDAAFFEHGRTREIERVKAVLFELARNGGRSRWRGSWRARGTLRRRGADRAMRAGSVPAEWRRSRGCRRSQSSAPEPARAGRRCDRRHGDLLYFTKEIAIPSILPLTIGSRTDSRRGCVAISLLNSVMARASASGLG